MKILGIDTTTKFLSLGIYDDGKIYEYSLETGRRLSALLAVTVERVLDAAGLRIQDIDYFACGTGPGSFTGIRTGMSAIKGMAWALDKPAVGIPTLDILAKNASSGIRPIIAMVDAKRSLIYCGFFKNKAGLKRERPYGLLNEEEFFKKAKSESIILGDAISLYRERLFRDIRGVTLLDKDCWYPKAHHILELALERIRNKKVDSAFSIKPIYLYPKECQIKNSVTRKSVTSNS